MPLINHSIKLPPGQRLGIWEITETSQQLLEQAQFLSPGSIKAVQAFKSERRRREWLASRLILCRMAGCIHEVRHRPSGQPYIPEMRAGISISHADGLAAVLVSDYPQPVPGIDVERLSPRILRIKDKFLLPGELRQIPRERLLETLYIHWCAKEAMYKAYNVDRYDYQNTYRLKAISETGIHEGMLTAQEKTLARFQVRSFQIQGCILCVAAISSRANQKTQESAALAASNQQHQA